MGVIGDTSGNLFHSSANSLPTPRSYGVPLMSIRPLFTQYDRSLNKPSDLLHAGVSEPSNRKSAKAVAVSQERGTAVWVMWVVLLVVAFVTLLVSRVSAQQANFPYDSLPMHPKLQDEAVVRSVEAQTKAVCHDRFGQSEHGQRATSPLYVPAKMTAPDGIKYISDLAKETNTLLARAQRSNKPQIAQQLTKYRFRRDEEGCRGQLSSGGQDQRHADFVAIGSASGQPIDSLAADSVARDPADHDGFVRGSRTMRMVSEPLPCKDSIARSRSGFPRSRQRIKRRSA